MRRLTLQKQKLQEENIELAAIIKMLMSALGNEKKKYELVKQNCINGGLK